MEKDKKKSTGRVIQNYSEDFKVKVIQEYLSSGISKYAIQQKYGLRGKSSITKWLKALGYDNIRSKKRYFEEPNYLELKKKNSDNQSSEKEDIASLKRQLKELEHALENEKLRSEAYRLTIEIAEKELNIPIRKKPSTK